MPKFGASRLRQLAVTVVLAGTCVSAAFAEPPARKDDELVRDFIHYIRIDRAPLAEDFGKALLNRIAKPWGDADPDKGMKLADFVKLIESSGELARFEEAVARAQRIGGLEEVASRLTRAFEQGKLDQARNAEEISRNISRLSGTQQQRLFARERLAYASEYAMPQLLDALKKRTDVTLAAEVRQLIVDMGRGSVMPLCAALNKLDPTMQELVAGMLGEIPYNTSIPFLAELRSTSKVEAVRVACDRAISRLPGPAPAADASVSSLFVALAEQYSSNDASLTVFPREEMQLVWNYDPATGLNPVPVRTAVWHQGMAMRLAERALTVDGKNGTALAIWLANNFSREIDTPKGYENPLYGSSRRDAMYYAVAAGPAASQRVLARALDARDTPLARKAIASIEKTAGTANIASGDGADRKPLLEALRYPNRRVQYEAALALAIGQPQKTFDGSERVVPILGSAIRDVAAKYALVLSDKRERADSLAAGLRSMGYTVLPTGRTLSEVEDAMASAPGIDLILCSLPATQTGQLLTEARGRSRLLATPVMAVLSAQGALDLGSTWDRDPTVRLVRDGLDPAQRTEAVRQLVESATGGPITAEEAADYQARCLAALRDLAIAGNPVFNVNDAAGPLIAAMGEAKGTVRMSIADVLSRVGDKRVQVALADAALAAQGDEMVQLLGKVTDSAKRFGNMLDDRQVKRVLGMTNTGSDVEATAVSALLGALNLPNDSLIPLILKPAAK